MPGTHHQSIDFFKGYDWKERKKKLGWLHGAEHQTVGFVRYQVAFQVLTSALMNEYTTYLLECMCEARKKRLIGASINRVHLRMKHVLNKKTDSVENITKEFFSHVQHRVLGATTRLVPLDTNVHDLLDGMVTLLGAKVHFYPVSNFLFWRES